jgi:RND family efflux transporter MFP subunit
LKTGQKYFTVAMLLISFNCAAFEVQGELGWSLLSVKSFNVQGTVEKVWVHSGERVKKGQLLAQLDRRSLVAVMEKHKASARQFDPLIFDAKVELNNAEELFERTVLSELDLQKKQGDVKELEAQQAVALADFKLAKIEYQDAQLKASNDARLVRVDITPGLVISDENMSEKKIILAKPDRMQARVTLSVEQAEKVQPGQKVSLNTNGGEHQGRVISIEQKVTQSDMYTINIEFEHNKDKMYLAGQKVSVKF